MVDKLVDKIKEFFNNIGCPVEILLRNPDYPNKELEYEYYVIYGGEEDIFLTEEQYSELCRFRRKNEITICPFYKENCKEGLIEDFKTEGYQLIGRTKP